jgi:regulatory protein
MTASKPSRSDRAPVTGAGDVDVSVRVGASRAPAYADEVDVDSTRLDRDYGNDRNVSDDRDHAGEVESRKDDRIAARDTALRLLAQREHSTDELRRKLKKRGYATATIAVVVESLDAARSVSDARFAEGFVRVRSERGQGPLKIRAELRERGVTDGVVDEVMTATADFWLERAQKARVKRFGDALPSDRDAWNQQARFLAQRGYPADLIYRTLGAVQR